MRCAILRDSSAITAANLADGDNALRPETPLCIGRADADGAGHD
jgi:hypothetical protein